MQLLKKLVGVILVLTGLYLGLLASHHAPICQSHFRQWGLLVIAWAIGGGGVMLFIHKPRSAEEQPDDVCDDGD